MRPERPSSLRRNNILAPVSLVCGILAWTLLPVLAALAAMFCGQGAKDGGHRPRQYDADQADGC